MEKEQEKAMLTTAFYKANDWYAKHNIGTRTALFVFLAMYALSVIIEVQSGSANHKYVVDLVNTTGWFAFLTFIGITFGDNAISKIGDIVTKIKGIEKGKTEV